jgi:predicted RNA-binding Zn-ribbon protein involved in translation (DUF1610 family)
VTTHSKLIYALKDGNIVSIDEVQSGKNCGCVCPACGDELIARKGEKRMHHFAHRSNEDCEYGYESSLHLAAKDILSRSEKMVIPPVYVEFPQSGKPKELISKEREISIDDVELEKRFDDIIADIVVDSGDEHFFIEIYVTHPIDDEKLKKLKEKKISTIEIDLSKEKRDISVEELSDILLKTSPQKSWKYNAVSEKWYQQFEKASDKMPLTQRGLALHVDGCPIGIRNWKGKNYANFVDDCTGCEYCISYAHEGYVLCSGRERIATKKDFLISKEERISNSNNPLPKIEKCPNCKVQLVRAKKDKGDVWQCPRCTFYIPVGFNSGEN